MKKYIVALLLMAGSAFATTNEITVSTTIKVNKNATKIDRATGTILIQMAGTKWNTQTLTTSTNNQFLAVGGVVTPGWCFMRNLSTSGVAAVSFDGGTTTSLVVEAQEPAMFRVFSSATPTNWTVKATSGTPDFEFTLIED